MTSIKSPYLLKKSAPIIGLEIFAIRNINGNSRRKPKSILSNFLPNVEISEPLAAVKTISETLLLPLNFDEGKTETSAPLSIKKFNLLHLSYIKRRRDIKCTSPSFVATTMGCSSLTNSQIVKMNRVVHT